MIDYNFLSDFTGLYSSNTNGERYTASSYIHDWEFLNASTTTSLETTNLRHSSRYVLSLRNPISEAYTFQSPIVEIPNAVLNKDFVFHAMFYSAYPANVQIYLYNWDNDHESVTPITTQLSAGEWTACFSNVFKFEDENEPNAHARVRIVISEHNSQVVRFTMPHLVYDKPFLDNTYFTYGKKFFPDVYNEVDAQQSGPSFPFMKLWHSLTSVAEGAMKDYIKILPTEYDELSVGLKNQIDSPVYNQFQSSLTNPDVMDENYMPWASMFIGSLIKNGIFVSPSVVQQTVPITYQIGDTGPAGGKIFITPSTVGNSTGNYFEAAPISSELITSWATNINSNQTTAVSGADGTAIGTGQQNTIDIVAQAGNVAATSAAADASGNTYGGFSDWFLPSLDELAELYTNRVIVGDFSSSPYWSSSEFDFEFAWFQSFNDGTPEPSLKYNFAFVRPVRMFAGTEEITVSTGTYQEVFQGGVDFSRRQLSTRMYGMGAGTRAALRNAARAVIGEEAAVLVSPLWQGDEWSIMVRTLTASTPGVSGSGQSSSAVYYAMEPAKPTGYTLLHQTVDAITFFLDDNDFGVFDQSILG